MTDPVYLDHAATTPLRPEVRDAMMAEYAGRWGNPSSVHRFGREARAALEDARARFAAVVGARPAEIVFTRGGTEADNLAVLGFSRRSGGRVACSAIEHSAVLRAAEASGRPLLLSVDGDGVLDPGALEGALDASPAVVAVMWASNETGAVQPVAEVAERCSERRVCFHTDAVQALGKVPVRLDVVPASTAAFSAHKLGGPRGSGALFVRMGTRLEPLLHGGGQERGLRPGTEDVAGAVGLALAAELAEAERQAEAPRLAALRDRLEAGLRERMGSVVVHAAAAERLPHILTLSIPGSDPELLLSGLDLEGIAASSGSACSSGAFRPSHVLLAMGVAPEVARPSLRFSLGRETTEQEIERVLDVLPPLAARLRAGLA